MWLLTKASVCLREEQALLLFVSPACSSKKNQDRQQKKGRTRSAFCVIICGWRALFILGSCRFWCCVLFVVCVREQKQNKQHGSPDLCVCVCAFLLSPLSSGGPLAHTYNRFGCTECAGDTGCTCRLYLQATLAGYTCRLRLRHHELSPAYQGVLG